MSVNVNREVTDDFYRYKMPKLLAKVEGKGNGIKTVIVNMAEVAKSLYRPPIYPTKFFGAELGAQIQYDAKNERYIVNGSHDADKLQVILDSFIRKYVLCSNCDNPETDLIVKNKGKQGDLSAKCKACGSITPIDYNRTTQFIIKNPPDDTGLALSTTAGGGKGSRNKGTAAGKRKGGDRSPENGCSDPEEGNHAEDTGDHADQEDVVEVDDDDWGDEIEETELPENLPESVQRLVVTDVLEMTPQDRANMFHAFVEKHKNSNNLKASELLKEAERLDIREKAVIVVMEVLLTNPATLAADITKNHTNLFRAFTANQVRAQRYLLGALENLIVQFKSTLMDGSKVSNLLNAFYSADILGEEVLLEWAKKGPSKRHTGDKKLSKQIHDLAKPFISWLETADEESSSEDDDVEEPTPDKKETVPSSKLNGQPATTVNNTTANHGGDNESDVDIDDI